MRSNIVSEAGLPTRVSQWWGGVPFITPGLVAVCGVIYLVCLLFGYDSFHEICFLPFAVVSRFQGQMLMDDHPTLFWTPCAAHCIYLMLHDICKLPIITTTVKRAIALNGYIYNHPYVLNMMRTFTEQKELIRPGVTRFATVFLTLQSIYNQKNKLRRMFTSEEWSTSRYHRDTKGKNAYETVMSVGFWNNILYSLRATGPLVRVLRLVDSEKKPAMGYIYEAMDRAKEAISKSFNYNEAKYYEIWEIIDKRWNDQLHRPLHAAGYYLNPEYFYSTPRIESNEELNEGFLNTMARLVPDEAIQHLVETELSLYRYARGVMGSPNAIRNRALWSPVYRIYTCILFHGSLLHVLFNMLAFVPLGTELERIMGSLRLLHLTLLLATTNAVFHLLIAFVVAHNPLYTTPSLMVECGIGFSGVIFSMIVIETSLSGVQSRSVFGLFSVPAQWYAWILLVVFQLLMSNVSLLGHLCGILSGFAYTYGLFNFLLAGSSFYSSIESSSLLSACVRRPGYILCTGSNPSAYLPTRSSPNTVSSGLISGDIWRNLSSWMPRRETTDQDNQRFPGRGRTLASVRTQSASDSDLSLQARLLDDMSDGRHSAAENTAPVAAATTPIQGSDRFEEEVKKLVAIGFEKTQAEVALAAADGDPNVAAEILMSQME